MISKNRIKFVQSLHKKKYRQKYSQFTVEGEKSVDELINSSLTINEIFCTEKWLLGQTIDKNVQITVTTPDFIQKVSFFNTASSVVAIAEMSKPLLSDVDETKWIIALDGINDPGNLGTIMRIADWYGIKDILCSNDTVDMFNPKCISATMGSFTRTNVHETDLNDWLAKVPSPKYFCLMNGKAVHQLKEKTPGIIVIGSEAHGIRENLMSIEHSSITINRLGSAESLNAAVATGIICDRLIQ